MVSLFDTNGNLITDVVHKSISGLDSIKITNRLLNGEYHIQNVGKVSTVFDIACYVTDSGKQAIDISEATGAPVKLIKNGKYYVGLIKEVPRWDPVIDSEEEESYIGQFVIVVNEEGIA